ATNGVLAFDQLNINAFAADRAVLSITTAASHKMIQVLSHTLELRGVFVAEVIVNGFVEGTAGAFDQTTAIAPTVVADAFWALHSQRQAHSTVVGQTVEL